MNPYAIGAAITLLVIYGYRAWRSAARRLAAIQEEFKTPAPEAIPPPAPDQDSPHGGTVTTIEIERCGRMVITEWDKGEAEIHHGECEACHHDRCYLCGFYLKFDPARSRWIPRYERCPAHEDRERQP